MGHRSGRAQMRTRTKQMGPALLPTPLSPARGYPVPCETSGGPSASLVAAHTWRPMSNPRSPNLTTGVLRLAHGSFVTGARAGIRLSLLPCYVRRQPKSPMFAAVRRRLAETVPLPIRLVQPVAACAAPNYPVRPGFRPVRCHSVAPFSNDPACLWPKPLACRLSMSAWTGATAIPRIKTYRTSRPCGFPFRLVCVPKTS